MDNRKRRRMNLGSLIGWLIFILVFASGPIFRLIGQALGGSVNLPANLPVLLIGGLVLLSILVSVLRAVGGSVQRRGDERLPTAPSPPARPMNAPMPPFSGPAGRAINTQSLSQRPARERLPAAPQFEPLINPRLAGVAVLGLLVLGGLALAVVIGSAP
jgi:hypothetical protein